MGTLSKKIAILLMLVSYTGFSQTPEEQEMIDNSEKIRDSITECITLNEMLQQVENRNKNKKSNAQFKNENKSILKINEE